MASAAGKTTPKPSPDVKKEQNSNIKVENKERKSEDREQKNENDQHEKPSPNKGRDNRFHNRGRGRGFQHQRFNQRGGFRGGDREGQKDFSGGGTAQFSEQTTADFMGEQNEGPKEQKKFTGRCRLFVGNITPDTTEEQFKEMFTPFGEVSEVFVNAARGFGFIRLDFRINAERAKMELDGQMRNNRVLRVRFATHGAALKVYNLSPFVSNELLEQAFSQFGEVERAVVCVDDRGRSCGEGIVEFARKPGAQSALKRINEGVFLLSAYPRPVRVEMLEQRDEEDGLTEKFVQRNDGFRKDREKEPRFAPPGSFEFEFGLKHRQIDDMEKERTERVKQEMENERTRLADEMETAIFDYQAEQIRQDLIRQQEELKRLDELKNEHMRRRQEMDMRRQQQMGGGMGDRMGDRLGDRMGGSMRQEEERRREMMMRASNAMNREREGGMNQGPPRGPPGRPEDMMRGGPGVPGSLRGDSQSSQRGPGTPPMPPPPVPPGMNMEQGRSGRGSFVGQGGSMMEGQFRQGMPGSSPGGMPGSSPVADMERPPPGLQGGMKGSVPRPQGPPPGRFPGPPGPGGPPSGSYSGPGGSMFPQNMPGPRPGGPNPNMRGGDRREPPQRDEFDPKRMRRY